MCARSAAVPAASRDGVALFGPKRSETCLERAGDDTCATQNDRAQVANYLMERPPKPTHLTAPAGGAPSRRQFLQRTSVGFATAAMAARFPSVLARAAAADGVIRIGVIGCGGRGTGAALDALGTATEVRYPSDGYHTETPAEGASVRAQDVEIMALADMFGDRLEHCRAQLERVGIRVRSDLCFTGFSAYEKVMEVPEVNYVILATPPFFRPAHLRAAVEAGKHAFVEKPVAVDPTGVRSILEAGEIARRKGLTIGAGTMRRREDGSRETLRRIRDGAIGEIIACEAIWSGGELWSVDRQRGWSDMENQLRNWLYYTWLSGDFIVEQFVHNLDMINWVLGEHPVRAFGVGGRQVRTDPRFGNIYDHFGVEFQYPSGVRCFALDRHTNGGDARIEEVFLGAKGMARIGLFGPWSIQPKGGPLWRYREPKNNPYHQSHAEFLQSIREGRALNESREIAESTLTAIMGRETAYSARGIEWEDALNASQDLSPAKLELGPLPVAPVPVPGRYRMI
jgi:predicted dehydrogenase